MRPFYPILLAAGVFVPAASASAAYVTVDRPCHLEGATVAVRGYGFTPGATFQVLLDDEPLSGGAGTVAPDGTAGGSLPATIGADRLETSHRVTIEEGAARVNARFRVTRVAAGTVPRRGDPRTMRVRFRASGFGLGAATRPDLYLHYVSPRGRLRRTVRLGRAQGPCGTLRTASRRLFAFAPEPGRWRLQIDARRTYATGRPRPGFASATILVTVRGA